MIRKINLSDLKAAVDEAYEQFKNDNEGVVDSRVDEVVPDTFGISVVLTDGTIINKGDATSPVAMGETVKIPLSSILLSQLTPDEIIKKSGKCPVNGQKPAKPQTPFSAHGMRAISAIEPTDDADGKWAIISDCLTNLMGTSPILDDRLYENLKKQAVEAKVEDTLAAAGYYLYDDAPIAIDSYLKAVSMKASSEQLAIMGATIAADGVNPVTKQEVFDGKNSANIVALMAAKGPHRMSMPWLMGAGIPAKSGFGGAMVGVMPGVMGIAAVSPRLNAAEISVKAAKAIKYIMNKLQLNVFASARVEFEA